MGAHTQAPSPVDQSGTAPPVGDAGAGASVGVDVDADRSIHASEKRLLAARSDGQSTGFGKRSTCKD